MDNSSSLQMIAEVVESCVAVCLWSVCSRRRRWFSSSHRLNHTKRQCRKIAGAM